jgi:anti-sigma regulatory factor (Ser/Thr protein kinase)
MAMAQSMEIEINNDLDQITLVMSALEEYVARASVDMRTAQAAELALDELLNNSISYGFPDDGRHTISVELETQDDALQIKVVDDGVPFNPFEQTAPDLGGSVEERKLGGVGIHLVSKFMDECGYQRIDEKNVVTLLKRR